MGYIVIGSVNLQPTPASVTLVTVSYKLTSAPDVSGSYTIVTTTLGVRPNGTLVGGPLSITGLLDDTSYTVKITVNCDANSFSKNIITQADPTVSTTTTSTTTTAAPTTTSTSSTTTAAPTTTSTSTTGTTSTTTTAVPTTTTTSSTTTAAPTTTSSTTTAVPTTTTTSSTTTAAPTTTSTTTTGVPTTTTTSTTTTVDPNCYMTDENGDYFTDENGDRIIVDCDATTTTTSTTTTAAPTTTSTTTTLFCNAGEAIKNLGTNNVRNNFNGKLGLRFVANSAIQINALGRLVLDGNSFAHNVTLYDSSYVTIVSASVVTAGKPANSYSYTPITPYTLTPGETYFIMSDEVSGQDTFSDIVDVVSTTDLTVDASIYDVGGGWNLAVPGSYSYVTVGFMYCNALPLPTTTTTSTTSTSSTTTIPLTGTTTTSTTSSTTTAVPTTTTTSTTTTAACSDVPAITSEILNAARNDFEGLVGFRFTVGASPIIVSDLGRWNIVEGSSQNHDLYLVSYSGGFYSVLRSALINPTGAPVGYQYISISPITLAANTQYAIISQEHFGGDYWRASTPVTGNPAITVDISVYESSGLLIDESAGASFGPLNFKFCGYPVVPTTTTTTSTTSSTTTIPVTTTSTSTSSTTTDPLATTTTSTTTTVPAEFTTTTTSTTTTLFPSCFQIISFNDCYLTDENGDYLVDGDGERITTDCEDVPVTSTTTTIPLYDGFIQRFTPAAVTNSLPSARYGFTFICSDQGFTFTHLGRMVVEGNRGIHKVGLANDTNTALDWVYIDTTNGVAGEFVYERLDNTGGILLTSAPLTKFFIFSEEFIGVDTFHQPSTVVYDPNVVYYDASLDGRVRAASAPLEEGTFSIITETTEINKTYVPVNFKYTL